VAFSDGIRGLDIDQKGELQEWSQALVAEGAGAPGNPPAQPAVPVLAIYRYYDAASRAFGDGTRPGMETYGWGLGRLILDLLDATGASGVYLVAHSMGGLVARTFLQNETVLDDSNPATGGRCSAVAALLRREPRLQLSQEDWKRARLSVRRFFTYATPHNGISGQGGLGNWLLGLVDALLGLEMSNFERNRMLVYLGNPPEPNSLGNGFPVSDTFCLVGTAASDYPVAAGFSSRLVGQLSDGLVEIDNAIVHGPASGGVSVPSDTVLAARAYVRRAHSGPYGIVNSEEGFGNLSRFLFGDLRVDGDLLVREIELPPELQVIKQRADQNNTDAGIRASYSFETALRVRGERWVLTERLARDGSAIFRRYDELFSRKKIGVELRRPAR
jgi:pimeloyl-ACP methyl ester carboxylesterase